MENRLDQTDLIRKLIECEHKNNFFDIKIDGIQIYPLIRMGLFYEILKNCKVYDPQPINYKDYRFKSILFILKKLFNNYRVTKKSNKKIAIIEHPRRLDGQVEDIYSNFLYNIFPQNTLTIKHPMYGLISSIENTEYDSFYYEIYLIKKRLLKLITRKNKLYLYANQIANFINREVDHNHNYFKYLQEIILDKIISCNLAKSFLSKFKLKYLIVVNGYGFNHFILAAKQLGIKVFELQHGNIYDTHLGYHYPYSKIGSIKCFPDYILTFGKYWNNQAKFPISKNRIKENGFYFFEQSKLKTKSIKIEKKNRFLIISQQNISSELRKITKDLAKKLENYHFIFKPHPKEKLDKSNLFDGLEKINNITISEKPLYELYPEVDYQIGVFSTAIYEGLGYGIKTFIYKINGWKNVYSLNQNQGVKFIKDYQELIEIINKNLIKKPDQESYFSSNVLENHKKFFETHI